MDFSISQDVATTTCVAVASDTVCTTPQLSLVGDLNFDLEIIIFLLFLCFCAFLFNGFGGRRRRL